MTPFRVALVDDHEIVARGFADLFSEIDEIEVVHTARTVTDLLATGEPVDLVILDLRLADASTPADNVRRIRETGAKVLAFTAGEDPNLVRSAAWSGVLGVVRKSEPADLLREVIVRAAAGETIVTTEWAAALDSDPYIADAGLSPREREVLTLYAAGAKAPLVAQHVGLSEATVIDYIRRIRTKYDRVGRTADTKIDLYKRAVEDGILPTPGWE